MGSIAEITATHQRLLSRNAPTVMTYSGPPLPLALLVTFIAARSLLESNIVLLLQAFTNDHGGLTLHPTGIGLTHVYAWIRPCALDPGIVYLFISFFLIS